MPDNFDAARRALTERFPEARAGIASIARRDGAHCLRRWARSRKAASAFKNPREGFAALLKLVPAIARLAACRCRKSSTGFSATTKPSNARWRPICLIITMTRRRCGGFSLRWRREAICMSGGRYVQGGSQRLSSALARAIKVAGGEVLVRRLVSGIAVDRGRPRHAPSRIPRATAAIPRSWKDFGSSAMPRRRRSRR